MSQRTPQQRPPAARIAAPAQRATAGPAGKSLKTLSTALNAAPTVQRLATMAPNRTGLPDTLKAGVEAMSGMSLDHVRVHRNSARPAQLNAHAYAQGSDIHLAPGQERHLPHEAWHVVQQAQGRVKPTMQMKGDVPVNDEEHLEHEADVMGARAMAGVAQRAPVEDEELQKVARTTVQRAASTAHRPVIQRAGVKAEMKAGEASFNEFINETAAIGTKRNEVATAIYNQYKPLALGKRNLFSEKVPHTGVNQQYNRKIALDKAKRLTHWTSNAVNGAARIYAELLAAMEYNSTVNVDHSEITFGKDTTTEPDVFPSNDTALEVKRIDSGAQGAVDGHITKVSEQLEERKKGPQKTDINTWVAKIQIDNPENPWPYTPVSLAKAVRSGNVDVVKVGRDRILKYENTTVHIRYFVSSANQNIGSFWLDT